MYYECLNFDFFDNERKIDLNDHVCLCPKRALECLSICIS